MIQNNLPEIEQLFKRYLGDQCTPEEVQLLMHYFDLDQHETALKQLIQEELEKPEKPDAHQEAQAKLVTDKLLQQLKKNIHKK